MLKQNAVVKLVRDGKTIIAVFADGVKMEWCDCKTERGAKSRLTHHAKRLGFKVSGNVAEPAK